MKKIYSKVLNDHFANLPGVLKAISYLPEDAQERFVEICIGCEVTIDELPKKIRRNGVVYTFISSNYLNNEVKSSYIATDVRYFATKDKAIEYSNSGNFSYSESTNKETTEYPYKGEHTHTKESYVSFETWMSSEVVDDDVEDYE